MGLGWEGALWLGLIRHQSCFRLHLACSVALPGLLLRPRLLPIFLPPSKCLPYIAQRLAQIHSSETEAEREEIFTWIRDKVQVRAPFALILNDNRYGKEGSLAARLSISLTGLLPVDFTECTTQQEPWVCLHIKWEDNVITKHHNVQVLLWMADWINHSLLPDQTGEKVV